MKALPAKLRQRMPNLLRELNLEPRLVLEELKYYTARFPEVPCFQNWLAKCLTDLGRWEEARALAQRTVDRHPEYLHGVTLLAQFLLWEGDAERVDALLGETKWPTNVAPDRSLFHATEVLAYFHVCGQWHLLRNEIKDAERCLDLLREIGPNHCTTTDLAKLCHEFRFGRGAGSSGPVAAAG